MRLARQALHAWRVSLSHPVSGASLIVTAPFPPDIAALLERVGVDGVLGTNLP